MNPSVSGGIHAYPTTATSALSAPALHKGTHRQRAPGLDAGRSCPSPGFSNTPEESLGEPRALHAQEGPLGPIEPRYQLAPKYYAEWWSLVMGRAAYLRESMGPTGTVLTIWVQIQNTDGANWQLVDHTTLRSSSPVGKPGQADMLSRPHYRSAPGVPSKRSVSTMPSLRIHVTECGEVTPRRKSE